MSDETFPIDFGNTMDNLITTPLGRNLNLVCKKNTTLFTDESAKEVLVPEKYVLLKITTIASGYALQKVYGHPNVTTTFRKSADPQPALVVPTFHAQLVFFDSTKAESGSTKHDINVTRDAWYYLGVDHAGATWCRNVSFEPADARKNRYLTEQIHFPPGADKNVHGFFLMQDEAQRGKDSRQLEARGVSLDNPYGDRISCRKSESTASNIMFHIGGFYVARAALGHAKWLGGSEGCFTFIPKESVHSTPEEASRVTVENAFLSNRTWVNLTRKIETYRDNDPQKRFIVEVEPRNDYARDSMKNIIMLSGALDRQIRHYVNGVISNPFSF
ncbi:hypothetical protein [Paraburkholderia pallida]|uniref:Uncharacterized protein n=1 Tax=Paraburkholderia pallida TaxID=2547399 RepID=A0A4P7CS58_9BURK|nr:hypothetical protein [Paraburkholderia pallida]QBQ98770.1 hypothetical protein E1956_15970 [Paraburkholderia pallida]